MPKQPALTPKMAHELDAYHELLQMPRDRRAMTITSVWDIAQCRLRNQQREVLAYIYGINGDPHTPAETARACTLSRSRIHDIEKRGLRNLIPLLTHQRFPSGLPGAAIVGSRYLRSYCSECGTAMRIPQEGTQARRCERCTGVHANIATRPGFPIDDVTGYQANAIRAMEGI